MGLAMAEASVHEQLFTAVLHSCESRKQAGGLHLIYHYRAVARFKQGKYTAAVQDARTAITICERFAPASCCCAASLLALGRAADAMQILHKALTLNPTDHDATALLARAQQAAASDAASRAVPVAKPPDKLPPGLLQKQLGPATFQPSKDRKNTNLLILLHGLGDTPKPYAALATRMALPQTASLALAGPIEVPETDGGRAWFQAFDAEWELIKPSLGEVRRSSSLAKTTALLVETIDKLVAAGWRHRCIHLLGFSQGGTAAFEVNWQFRGKQRLGGCISIAGSMLEELQWQRQQAGSTATVTEECGPLLLTLGDRDPTTTRSSAEKTVQLFQQHGVQGPCQLFMVPGKGHGMIASEVEMTSLMRFWSQTLASRPPGEDVVELVN